MGRTKKIEEALEAVESVEAVEPEKRAAPEKQADLTFAQIAKNRQLDSTFQGRVTLSSVLSFAGIDAEAKISNEEFDQLFEQYRSR